MAERQKIAELREALAAEREEIERKRLELLHPHAPKEEEPEAAIKEEQPEAAIKKEQPEADATKEEQLETEEYSVEAVTKEQHLEASADGGLASDEFAGELRQELLALGAGARGQPVEALVDAASAAWEEARREQRLEIEFLREKLPRAEAAWDEQRAPELKVGALWEQAGLEVDEKMRAENESGTFVRLLVMSEEDEDEDDATRAARGRELGAALFDFHSFRLAAPTVDEDGQPLDAEVALEGEGVLLLNRTRARLARLEEHEAAGRAEYRLLGAALAASAAFGEAAAAGLPRRDERDTAVARAVGRFLRLLPGFDAQELREDIEKSGDVNSEKERQAAEDLIEAAQGKARPPFWLEEFGALARRWHSLDFDFDEDVEQAFADSFPVPVFPAMLFLLCVRMGAFEPIAAYVVARAAARLNAKALEPAKALVDPAELDRQIAVQEQQLLDDFAQAAVVWLSVGALAALVLGALALWYVSGLVGDGLLGLVPPPPDPFVQLDMM